MKKFVRIALIVVAVLAVAFFALQAWTKSKSPAATAAFHQGGLDAEVQYCQPAKKGRVVFGQLVPYGKVWRTGANEATIIEFKQDVKIAGQPLKAGSYTLWTMPNATEWTIIINSKTGQWGTMYDESADVLRVNVPARQKPETVEMFQISFAPQSGGADMLLRWEQTEVAVPIRLQ